MLSNVLSYFNIGTSEMPVSVLNTFLGVVIWGGDGSDTSRPRTIAEVAEKIGLPESTVYQHIRYLGTAPHRYGKPGLGLIETTVNPANRRQKLVRLTPEGATLMATIAGAFKTK